MLSSNDVRDVRFSKAMGGYKQEEVDAFLDTVEEDFRQYETYVKSLQEKLSAITAEVEEYKTSQASLQSVLISAQQLADNIVAEAKGKAQKIIDDAKAAAELATSEAKNMLVNFDEKLGAKKEAAEKDLEEALKKGEAKRVAIETATADSVKREQALFDKIRLEIAAFKSELMEAYKKHIEIISKLPDCVAMDAESAAAAVALEFDKIPDVSDFIKVEEDEVASVIVELDDATEKKVEVVEDDDDDAADEIVSKSGGFVVSFNDDDDDIDTKKVEDDDDDVGFSNSFFSKKK
ncbi:MAG: DivIVA domain-containing protein [Ruminococcaceae bacterium]|nr:DivIVA domain-containing protein [Oscillospiraceae bacterium]